MVWVQRRYAHLDLFFKKNKKNTTEQSTKSLQFTRSKYWYFTMFFSTKIFVWTSYSILVRKNLNGLKCSNGGSHFAEWNHDKLAASTTVYKVMSHDRRIVGLRECFCLRYSQDFLMGWEGGPLFFKTYLHMLSQSSEFIGGAIIGPDRSAVCPSIGRGVMCLSWV